MDPSELPLWQSIDAIRERDPEYAREAYIFVIAALGATVQALPDERKRDDHRRHLTGGELLEGVVRLARQEFGWMAPTVFEEWGVRAGEDVGTIVFRLVDSGQLSKRPEDTLDDFRGGPDLLRALSLPSPAASASQAGDG